MAADNGARLVVRLKGPHLDALNYLEAQGIDVHARVRELLIFTAAEVRAKLGPVAPSRPLPPAVDDFSEFEPS